MDSIAEILFNYIRDVIYDAKNAALDVEALPEDFRDLGEGLQYLGDCVIQTKTLAQDLSRGDLNTKLPPSNNEIAAPLKALHSSLKHLTWQAQQIAQGDYSQHVDFMGDFSESFNAMIQQLEERRVFEIREKSKLQRYINLILSNTPNMILAFDIKGEAVFASESFTKENTFFSGEEIQGKTFSELFTPDASIEFIKKIENLYDFVSMNKTMVEIEQELDFEKDGTLRTYTIIVTPMFHENETFMGIMIIFGEITEIVRARELAEQSAQAKSDFLARMSHEMHTPMNAITGMAAIGKSSHDTDKKDQSFQIIEDASAQLLRMINDILDMSKMESDEFELSQNKFCLEEMLSHACSTIKLLAEEKKQTFTIDIDENIPVNIISDEQRLSQVVVNLLSNAVKFTPEHGSLSLSARMIDEKDGYCGIRFNISDTGIGIPVEHQERLFLPFEQVDGGNTRKFGGVGLGLPISKNIVNRMGGKIWVESELGKGSSFIFEINTRIGDGEGDDSDLSKKDGSGDRIFSDKKILIAEDVDINREIISALLDDTGIEIRFAGNGVEVVEMFSSDPGLYDLILMDIQMPLMDGYEATRRIRASGFAEAGNIPIIAMTANTLREEVEECLSAGMNSHLGKPVDIDDVIATLKYYFNEHIGEIIF